MISGNILVDRHDVVKTGPFNSDKLKENVVVLTVEVDMPRFRANLVQSGPHLFVSRSPVQ